VTAKQHSPFTQRRSRKRRNGPDLLPGEADALAYLASLDKMGIRLGLDEVRRLLLKLKNPHLAYPSILIGGTNGKGSIAAMAASILIRSGYRVGLYTSPHLVDINERIRINGRAISHEHLVAVIDRIRRYLTEPVTWFEFVTAAAFLYFADQRIDVAVLEVGMGGRLDATNVTDPIVSVVSNISHEHQAYLGNRLSQIAAEKGAIVREGKPCITAVKQPSVIRLLEAMCREKVSPLYRLGKDFRIRRNHDGTFHYRGLRKEYESLVCPLMGRHQYDNAGTALAAIEALRDKGFRVSDAAVSEGLKRTRWEGRLEMLRQEPAVLVDGAHNPAGIAVLCRSLQYDFHYRRLIVIFGALSDKDATRMLQPLCRLAHRMIITEPAVGRALPSGVLTIAAKQYHRRVETIADPRQALEAALASASTSDLICITGSLYLVGEIKKAFPFAA
jgi:dihydrofolate synthase/folylpolyglutamate synthase